MQIDSKLKWWERLLLWFKKPQSSFDIGTGYGLVFKTLFGKIYILNEWWASPKTFAVYYSEDGKTLEFYENEDNAD